MSISNQQPSQKGPSQSFTSLPDLYEAQCFHLINLPQPVVLSSTWMTMIEAWQREERGEGKYCTAWWLQSILHHILEHSSINKCESFGGFFLKSITMLPRLVWNSLHRQNRQGWSWTWRLLLPLSPINEITSVVHSSWPREQNLNVLTTQMQMTAI